MRRISRGFIRALALSALFAVVSSCIEPPGPEGNRALAQLPPPVNGRDLRVEDLSIYLPKPQTNIATRVTVSFRIVNNGTVAVTNTFRTRIMAAGTTLDVDTPALGVAGSGTESVWMSRTYTVPGSGTMSLSVTTDLNNTVAEVNESNNGSTTSVDANTPAAGQWYAIGPRRIANGTTTTADDNTGALFAIAVNPSNPSEIYAGGGPAGIWKTLDDGATWSPVGYTLPTLTVTSIAIDPSATSRVYAATNMGLFRSEDAGTSWRQVNPISSTAFGPNLTVDPTNSNRLALNTGSGIAISSDRGVTWTTTLSYPGDGSAYGTYDLIRDPVDSNRLYATTRHNSDEQKAGLFWGAPNGTGVFTWHKVWGCPGDELPSAVGKMIRVAKSGDTIYVSFRGAGGSSYALYKTNGIGCAAGGELDTGFDKTAYNPSEPSELWSRLYVDPTDPRYVYATGTRLYRSSNFGASFSASSGVHADHQDFAVHPTIPSTIWTADDGGLHRSTDRGAHWTFVAEGLQSTSFYDSANSPADGNVFIGGLQDNGNVRYEGSSTVWNRFADGDGERVEIDATGTRVYHVQQGLNRLVRTEPTGSACLGCSLPPACDSEYDYQFVADPLDPTRVLAACGGLWRSTANGSCGTCQDTTCNECPDSFSGNPWTTMSLPAGAVIRRVAIDAFGRYYFAGDANGRVYAQRDTALGSTWALVYTGAGAVRDIDFDPADPKTIYVVHNSADAGSVVRLKRPSGWTLSPLTGTSLATELPQTPRALAVDRANPQRLFVATAQGVWAGTPDSGPDDYTWSPYVRGMPLTADVRDVDVHPVTGVLRAVTFGQGAFEVVTDRSTYTLTAAKQSENGGAGTVTSKPTGISCGSDCSQSFTAGTTVTLTAIPSAGSSYFDGWTNCPLPSGGKCTVVMTASRTVTARFSACFEEGCIDACVNDCLNDDGNTSPAQCYQMCQAECVCP